MYNASEYTVNGKTYRNLEAEVLYNHRLSEQNAADIDALEDRMHTAEGDIDVLEGRMDTAEDDIDTLEGRLDALGDTIYYYTTFNGTHPTYEEVVAKSQAGYLPAVKTSSPTEVFIMSSYTANYVDFISIVWSNGTAKVDGRRLNKTSPGTLQVVELSVPTDGWIETLADLAIDNRIVTSISASNTNDEIPSAKAAYDNLSTFIIQRSNLGVWNKTFSEIQTEINKDIRPIELHAYIDASEYEIYKLKNYSSSSSTITFYRIGDRVEKQLWINDDNTTGSETYDLMPGMKITLSYDGSLNLVADKTYSEIMTAINNNIYVYLVDSGGNFANLSSAIDLFGQIRFCSVSCVSSSVTVLGYQVTSGNVWTQYNTVK